jgi:membrane protease YdiL (CAAX protease family)
MSSVPPPAAPWQPSPTSPPPDPADSDGPPWPLWLAPAGIVIGLAAGIFMTIFVELIGSSGGSSLSHPTPAVSIAADIVFDLGFVLAALYLTNMVRRARPADFGYRLIPLWRGVLAFVAAAVGYYVVTTGYAALVKFHGTDKLPSELGVTNSTAALVAATVFVCVLAPIAEEFFFRGFLFGVLRRWRITVAGRNLGPWVAAVIVGILFGLAHTGSASSQYLIPLGFLGFVLCLVRWRTGSLYPCMALHSVNNALALGVNQEHWGAGPIVALALGSLAVIGLLTGPLARFRSAD